MTRGIKRLVAKIHRTGWDSIIIKPELSAWSFGIERIPMEEVTFSKIKSYLRENKDYPRFIIQEALRGLLKNGKFVCFISTANLNMQSATKPR